LIRAIALRDFGEDEQEEIWLIMAIALKKKSKHTPKK
jgi:hypothetical protein